MVLDVWHPTAYVLDGGNKMRVLPKLTIDRILLLSVLLSCVYLFLYGTMPSDGRDFKRVNYRSRHDIRPGQGFGAGYENVHHFGEDSQDEAPTFATKPHISGIKFPEIVGSPSGEMSTCPSHSRVQFLREKCSTSPARTYDYDQGDRQLVRYAVVDHDRKLFYCLIGKAGSKSWLKYMVDSKTTDEKGHLRHNDFLQKVGLEMLRNVPIEKVEKNFKNYFKFLVVRHPLQRAVSAFYETVVLHEKYKNERGALLNFTEFAQRVSSDLMDENPHWRRYINRCKVCKVDYQYVIKTETMDDDIKDFNEVIGNRKDQSVQFGHQNRFLGYKEDEIPKEIHHYKYDKQLYTLQRKHPDVMKKFINVYAEDMQLFGYRWDWVRGKSSCGAFHGRRECC